jgi:hypothetical protein
VKRFLEAVTPPFLVTAARRHARRAFRSRRGPEWEYVPGGWAAADDTIRGWSVDGPTDAYMAKLPAFRDALVGTAPLGIATSAAVPVGAPNVF